MTAKFDAFKAALEALCIEHGVKLVATGYDDSGTLDVLDLDGDMSSELDLYDYTLGTPEEKAQAQREYQERLAAMAAENAERTRLHLEYLKSPEYLEGVARIAAEGKRTREQCMRVSSDPTSPEYNPRVLGVTLNDRQVQDWFIADDFRRCVILKDGKVLNGSVGFELAQNAAEPQETAVETAAPIDSGFSGVFVAAPDSTPAPTTAPTPAPKKHKRRR
jgi:hypothetical protein